MNRHVNRLVLIGAVASLALASCNKNKETEGGIAPENGFRATVEANPGNGSRTHLVGAEVQWNAGDQIKVRNANGTVCTYQLTEGENTSNGIFYSGEDNNIDFFQPTYTAIYPATGNSITGEGAAQFTLPATQSYAENSFGNGAMPMMAVSGDQTLAFKNVLGGICIPLKGDGLTVTKVVLTSNTNEPLNGVFNANYNNGQPTLSHTSGGTNSITLECNPAVTLSATTATDFIFMVPAGALASGFSVTAYDGETAYVDLSTTANPNITRSMISKVNTSLEVELLQLNVTTISPTFITKNSAKGLGMVDNTPVSCGILYALATDLATPADDLVVGGTNVTNLPATAGTRFDADLSGLTSDLVYYVRAYAVNEVGTVTYGDPIPFATRYDYYGLRNGKSRSEFSVTASSKVNFSMGNLQYRAQGGANGNAVATAAAGENVGGTWRFAENQFDYVGDASEGLVYEGGAKCNNALMAQNYSGWIDLFCWGTSGYNHGAVCYQPWSTSQTYSDYYAYGQFNYNLNDQTGQADWGYNAISNGGNTENSGWHALRSYESNNIDWYYYLFNMRTCAYRYAQALLYVNGTSSQAVSRVNGLNACGTTVEGIIVFPDDFAWPTSYVGEVSAYNSVTYSFNNQLTESQWSLLEQAGAVFLPAAGNRFGTLVALAAHGTYWSSTCWYSLLFRSRYINYDFYHGEIGVSVRLVCPAE